MNVNNSLKKQFPVFFLLTLPLTLFFHVFILSEYFSYTLPFWNIHLLLSFEFSVILLGLTWVVYSKIIAKIFNLDLKEALQKDLYTLYPLVFLTFYLADLSLYTNNSVSTKILLAAIAFLIIILKAAMILHIIERRKYAYLLISIGIILPLFFINYFIYLDLTAKPSPDIEYIIPAGKLEKLYNADPLSLFNQETAGYKKKIEINNEIRNALVLQPPARIETAVNITEKSYLQFGFGVWEESYEGKGDGVQLNVFVKNKKGVKKIGRKYIDPKRYDKDRKWFDIKLDMSDYMKEEISIIFEVSGSAPIKQPFERKENNKDDYAVISDPRIFPYNPIVNSKARNIIFISLDTLRADYLGCYGHERKDISPHIDELAKQGILFEKAISSSPWTTPSHVSMFTSLLPSYHRVNMSLIKNVMFRKRGGGFRVLSEDVPTLAGILRSKGYITSAFTGGGCMLGSLGFCLGFDEYRMESKYSFASEPVFNEVEAWLETHKKRPFFLFLHTFRIHEPYHDQIYADEVLTKSEYKEIKNVSVDYSEDNKTNIASAEYRTAMKSLKEKMKPGRYEKLIKLLYEGGIKKTDEYIGKLIKTLKKLDLISNTIIILLSDHGEELNDHNSLGTHGFTLYDEMIRVPFIFVAPGDFPKGKQIKSQIRTIDIMPTLLDLLKIKYIGNGTKMQGISLLPVLKGEEPDNIELPAISECTNKGPEMKSIRSNKYKYIYSVNLNNEIGDERTLVTDHPDKEELFDLEYDPGEKLNLFPYETNLSNRLKNRINKTLEPAVKTLHTDKKNKRIEISEKAKRGLKALGYIQ